MMTEDRPFGANTLVIPFTWKGAAPKKSPVARMSRMRPAGELFRNGVVNTADAQLSTNLSDTLSPAVIRPQAPVPPRSAGLPVTGQDWIGVGLAAATFPVGIPELGLTVTPAAARPSDRDHNSSAGRNASAILVTEVGTARLLGGSADLVAGSDVPAPSPEILGIERRVEEIAEEVKNEMNPIIYRGMPRQLLGTELHKRFRNAVEAANLPGVSVEQPFKDGFDAAYGEAGTLRTDVVLRHDNRVIAIWDYKTGVSPYIPPAGWKPSGTQSRAIADQVRFTSKCSTYRSTALASECV